MGSESGPPRDDRTISPDTDRALDISTPLVGTPADEIASYYPTAGGEERIGGEYYRSPRTRRITDLGRQLRA